MSSAVKTFRISLEAFEFPADLENNKANFRFIADLRYTDESGEFATEHAVMPSLDTFWECDTRRSGSPNFVRAQIAEKTKTWAPRFDIGKIDEWDRLVLRLKAVALDSIQIKVIDVDRVDILDKLGELGKTVVEATFRVLRIRVLPQVPGSGKVQGILPSVHRAFGSAIDDIESFLLKKLAGGGDKVLFRGSADLPDQATGTSQEVSIDNGHGRKGKYLIKLRVAAD